MANGILVKFNNAIFRAILRSYPTQQMLKAKGMMMAARANSMYGAKGYGCKVKVGKNRAHAFVYTGNKHTINSNFRHDTLRKGIIPACAGNISFTTTA